MIRATMIASVALCLTLASSCTKPRFHSDLHMGDGGAKMIPTLSTSIAGFGLSVTP